MLAGRPRQRHVAHGGVKSSGMKSSGMKSSGMKSSGMNRRRAGGGRLTGRRLTVTLILTAGAVAYAGPASAALPALYVTPQETTPAMFTLMDIWASNRVNSEVVVRLNGTIVAIGATDGNGNYASGDVPVPAGAVFCGSNNVAWYNNDSADANWLAGTTVMVYCPTVQVTPNPLSTGGGPATFTVTGSGYPPDRAVILTLDGTQLPFNNTYTDPNGAITTSVSNPALACGSHRLTMTSQPPPIIEWEIHSAAPSTVDATPPIPASTTITVNGVGCAPSPSPSPTPPQSVPPPSHGTPKITANPTVLVDGTLTHVTGSGFVPSQPVTLTWQTLAGAKLSVCSPNADNAPPLTADAKGAIDTFCYAVPHEMLGAEQIVAVQGTAHAAAPVVIEGGSMQPSSGDQFIFRR